MPESIEKLYYSIGEVSEMTGLKQYVLRYWETEFDFLQPLKNRSGNRTYTKEDIEKVLIVKKLLYDEKFTIEGAKLKLKEITGKSKDYTGDVRMLITEIKKDLHFALNLLKPEKP